LAGPVAIPNALVKAVRDRQAVLFAGAGISRQALGIGGVEVRDAIGAQIEGDYPGYDYSTRTFEDVCDEFVAINDRTGLVNEIAALIPTNVAATKGHVAAVEGFRFIVTTNWDLLFEEAYRQIHGCSIAWPTSSSTTPSSSSATAFATSTCGGCCPGSGVSAATGPGARMRSGTTTRSGRSSSRAATSRSSRATPTTSS
jgi:hypothetical protein